MISVTLTYLFQSAMCWGLFLLFYQLFLRKSSHFQLSRIYLLSALLLGAVIPLLPNFYAQAPDFVYTFQGQLDEFAVVVEAYTAPQAVEAFDWSQFLKSIYTAIVCLLLFRIVFGINKIYQIKPERKSKLAGSIQVNFHHENIQPFSFLNTIFIPTNYPTEFHEVVLAHEMTHVRQGHSFDIILSRTMTALFWINPLTRLFERLLKETHEHIADQKTLSNHDMKAYQGALRFSAFTSVGLRLAHAFNSNNIRKRLLKMKTKNSSAMTRILYIAILPIAVFLSVAMNTYDGQTIKSAVKDLKVSADNLLSHSPGQMVTSSDTIPPAPPAPPSPPAATVTSSRPAPPPPPPPVDGNDQLYKVVDEMPRFPGCESIGGSKEDIRACANNKLVTFLGEHIRYPDLAKQHGVNGVVLLQFTVTNEGKIDNAIISRNVGHGCGEEALRVVQLMNEQVGNWIPGRQKGKAVNVQYHLPVKFKIDSEGDKIPPPPPPPPPPTGMLEFIYKNIQYPSEAKDQNIEGKVLLQYKINGDGSLNNISITKDIGGGCGEEALRVMKLMNHQGQHRYEQRYAKNSNPDATHTLPILFKLGNNHQAPSINEYEEVFKVVEDKPRFPGCEELVGSDLEKEKCAQHEMLKFLYEHIKYPELAKKNGTEGTTVIQFIVEKDGSLSGIKIVRDVKDGCGQESARVVQLMNNMDQKWIPGKQRGKAVRVQYNLPVKFKLDDNEVQAPTKEF